MCPGLDLGAPRPIAIVGGALKGEHLEGVQRCQKKLKSEKKHGVWTFSQVKRCEKGVQATPFFSVE